MLLAMAIGTVWIRLTIVRTTYSINETERMIRNLKLERQRTELKLSNLRSPKRLEALAKNHFGLAQPRPDHVVYFK